MIKNNSSFIEAKNTYKKMIDASFYMMKKKSLSEIDELGLKSIINLTTILFYGIEKAIKNKKNLIDDVKAGKISSEIDFLGWNGDLEDIYKDINEKYNQEPMDLNVKNLFNNYQSNEKDCLEKNDFNNLIHKTISLVVQESSILAYYKEIKEKNNVRIFESKKENNTYIFRNIISLLGEIQRISFPVDKTKYFAAPRETSRWKKFKSWYFSRKEINNIKKEIDLFEIKLKAKSFKA